MVLTQQLYLQSPYLAISSYPDQGRAALLPAINTGLDECMHAIAKQADGLTREHPNTPPPCGSEPPAARPLFTRLKALLLEGCVDGVRSVPWFGKKRRRRQPVQEPGSGSRLQAQEDRG